MTDMRRTAIALTALLSACAPVATVPVAVPRPMARPVNPAGLERVLGHDATSLVALFGPPDQDQREATARRLQFVGPACVLDVYLYARGGSAPVATWIDARSSSGEDFNRASCVAALVRRGPGG